MPHLRFSELNSYDRIQSFLAASPALSEVIACSSQGKDSISPETKNWENRWTVCQWVSSPIRYPLAWFLRLYARVFSFWGCESVARCLKSLSDRCEKGFDFSPQARTEIVKIIHSQNKPSKEAKVFNRHPSIPTNDPKIHRRMFSVSPKIRFQHKGVCSGEVLWFLYMFWKTQPFFKDPRQQMLAIGKLFKNGCGVEPILLQSLQLKKGKLLGLRLGKEGAGFKKNAPSAGDKEVNFSARDYHSLIISGKRLEGCTIDHLEDLRDLPDCAYQVSFNEYGKPYGHATAWVKISKELGYFFDPNQGIFEIRGPDQMEGFTKKCIEVLSCLRRGNHEGRVSFIACNKRGIE